MTVMTMPSHDYLLRPWSGTWVRDALLVSGAVAVTAALAQVSIPVPGSPVPVTGQTLAVLLVGTTMGVRRGTAAMGLYLLVGAAGLPVFSDGTAGPQVLLGATGGYLLGFVLAAAVMGWAAERGWDRRPGRTLLLGLAGQGIIFGVGVPWLALAAGLDAPGAVAAGFTPFLLGGVIKGLVAAAALPVAWRLVRRARRR